MKANVIRNFEERVWHPVRIKSKQVVSGHVFPGNEEIIAWLSQLVKMHLLNKIVPDDYKTEITTNEKITRLVQEGDAHYFNLFRKEDLINAHTQEGMEKPYPLSYVLERIFAFTFMGDRISESHLTVYSDLTANIKYGVGNLLAADIDLQTYESWLLMCDYLECEHEIFNGWSTHIPDDSIEKEILKLCEVKPNASLADIAFLGRHGKDNEAMANYYTKKIAGLSGKTDWAYISEATDGMDILDFNGHIFFRQKLLRRIGINKWLMLADGLQYPILQDHLFLNMDDIDDYVKVISEIITGDNLKTKPGHLLLIALQNYFEFVSRTLRELNNFASGGGSYNHPDRDTITADAQAAYDLWVNKIIMDSFAAIVSAVFPEDELHKSAFFIPFFDWASSHNKESLGEKRNKDAIAFIDIINNQFQNRLNKHAADRHVLISNLKAEQLRWPVFEKLVSIYGENTEDLAFRDGIIEKYILYLSSENFRWTAKDNINFEVVINQAYHFAQVLASCPDALNKWQTLFQDHRIYHEGWLKTGPDYKANYRESFLLAVGIGMAYHLYAEGKLQLAEEILLQVINTIVTQYRSMGDYSSADYIAPLKFVAITISKYVKSRIDWFLNILVDKFDRLPFLLIVFYELSLYETEIKIPHDLQSRIRQRIDNEFWMIANRKSHMTQREKLDYYRKLQTEILGYLNKIQDLEPS